ncbi:hypothetical protein Acr_00g0045660 [Actinidia rufa]|uniref:Uncharacterized protein n=1 Tax=Actinidia rufa TaxID=165716 RepID=A0A7J0DJB8_9ERIC|nr:hypothetical protein Acr_00g0045660 [Actinidia rufa]
MASSGGDNVKGKFIDGAATSGDEGKSLYSRDELCPGNHTRDHSVEYIGTVRSKRLLSRLPDQILLSILGPKVRPSFLNWEPVSSSSTSGAMMSKRISLKKLAQKVEEAKGMSLVTKFDPATKGVVIGEKHPRAEASNVSLGEAIKGATPALAVGEGISANPGITWGLHDRECCYGRKDSVRGNPSFRQGEGRQALLGSYGHQVVVLGSSLVVRSRNIGNDTVFHISRVESVEMEKEKKSAEELKAKNDAMARLDGEVAELKKKVDLSKGKVDGEYGVT